MLARGEGRIINIGSISGLIANRGIGGRHYETSKAALIHFTRAVAADWAPRGVTVNAICPGLFMTEPNQAWAEKNPDLARRTARAIVETARWANAHHAETARMLAGPSHIDPATFAQMTRSTYGTSLAAAMLQPQIDAAFKYGVLKEPFDARTVVADARPYWTGIH